MLYEIISPDAFLRPYVNDYGTLSSAYQIVRNAYTKRPEIDREFQKKTAELVREQIQSTPIKLGTEIYKIDAESIELIKEKNQPDEVKIINLIKSIQKIAAERADDPVLISVKERAEDIMDDYTGRQITTQEALRKLVDLAEQEAARMATQEQEGISSVAWFIRDVLTAENIVDMGAVKDLESIVTKYPEFAISEKLTRDLRNDLYDRLESLGLSLSEQKAITDRIIETIAKTHRE